VDPKWVVVCNASHTRLDDDQCPVHVGIVNGQYDLVAVDVCGLDPPSHPAVAVGGLRKALEKVRAEEEAVGNL